MKGYTFFLGAAFLLTTTGAALAQNNLQSAKQRVEAITNAGTVLASTSTPGGYTGPYTGPSKYPIRTLQITPPPSPQNYSAASTTARLPAQLAARWSSLQ